MSGVAWLQVHVIEAVHLRQLAEHGGATGLRDRGLLETALAKPRQFDACGVPARPCRTHGCLSAHGIVHLHPFVHGNRRTALVAALLWLRLNGQHIDASQEECDLAWIALAAGDLDEAASRVVPRAPAPDRCLAPCPSMFHRRSPLPARDAEDSARGACTSGTGRACDLRASY